MAALASRLSFAGELAGVDIAVAGGARRGKPGEGRSALGASRGGGVARSTGDADMAQGQRESRRGVIERRGAPGVHAVAGRTTFESGVPVHRAQVRVLVAVVAFSEGHPIGGGLLPRGAPMALVARDRPVRSFQTVRTLLMIFKGKAGGGKSFDIVAGLAGAAVGAGLELPAMVVGMAVRTALVLKLSGETTAVTIVASDGAVTAQQGEGGFRVIELRGLEDVCPGRGGVARSASRAKTAAVGVRMAVRT